MTGARSARAAGARRLGAAFWALGLSLLLVFLTGGGSRSDVSSLAILRPASALLLGFAFWGLTRAQMLRHRFILAMAAAIVAFVLIQLLPVPPALWSLLPGRSLIVDIDAAAGLGAVWRPISLVPSATWNALFSLIPPLAVLILAVRLGGEERWWIALLLIGIGLFSALLAVLQLGGDPKGALYFYRVTNEGSAVGLFANRNHQAVFLASLFPLLAAYASAARPSKVDARMRAAAALAIGVFLLPLILVTGSRMGFVTAIIGLVSVPMLYTMPASRRPLTVGRRRLLQGLVVVGVAGIVAVTILLGRAVAFERIIAPTAAEAVRGKAWGPMFTAAMDYFPIGAGFGSFGEIFKIHEPRDLLAPTIFAHAHNDWLELLLTGGLPALLLLGIAIIAFIIMAVRWWRLRKAREGDVLLGGAGLWMLLIFAIASIGDYPLRVPSLSCLFSVIVLWISSLASDRIAKEGV